MKAMIALWWLVTLFAVRELTPRQVWAQSAHHAQLIE